MMKNKKAVMALCTLTMIGTIGMNAMAMAENKNQPSYQVAAIGNKAVEDTLNKAIADNTVNKTDEENHVETTTAFEEKYRDDKKISFVITTLETSASSYTKKLYYNTDLETGKELTLQRLLGDNYKEIVDKAVKEQMKDRMEKDENQIFFGFSEEDREMGIEGFTGIKENQTFYINEKGNVVVSFGQFEIAPGYMGTPEFEIAVQK